MTVERTRLLIPLLTATPPLWASAALAADGADNKEGSLLVPFLFAVVVGLVVAVIALLRRTSSPLSSDAPSPFEHHTDLVVVTDAEGRWVRANHAALTLAGLSGRPWRDRDVHELRRLSPLLAGDGAPLVAIAETLRTDGGSRTEIVVENNLGEKVAYELLRTPLTDEHGDLRGSCLIGREMTTRRRTARTTERFRQATEGSQTVILFLRNHDRRVTYGNRTAARMIGVPQERLVGLEGERLFPDLEEPHVAAHLARLAEGDETSYLFETMLMRWDGRLLPVEVALERVASPDEEPFFALSCWDLTDQRRADKALKSIMGGIARETGDHFFRSLAAALLGNLNLTGVGVARFVDRESDRVATMVLSAKGGALPAWEGRLSQLAAGACVDRREPITVSDEGRKQSSDDPLWGAEPNGIRGIPLFNVEGNVIGLLWIGFVGDWAEAGVDDDILKLFALRVGGELERLEAAAALGRSEEKYRKLYEWREWILEHSPEGIVHLDADLRIQFMSPAMARILGAPASGPVVIGRRVDEIPPMVAAGFADELAQLPRGKEVSIEREYTSLYGKTALVSLKGIPTFEEGRFTGAVLMVSDITEIHEAHEALARSERFLAQAQRLAHIGSFVWDFVTGEVAYSDELFHLFGYEPGAFVPTAETFADAVHPDDVVALRRMLDDDRRHQRRQSDTTYRIIRANGDVRHIMARTEYTYDEQGNTLQMLGTLHDITDAQLVQEALRRAQKLESLGLMAGGVAHDFNNLLVGIIGNISLALEEIAEDDPARDTVARSLASARKAADLANQMLAYSGKGGGERTPISLPPLIEELTDLLTAGLPKMVSVDYRLDPATPLIVGDETQIRQVVTNLIMNGAEAIGDRDGKVTVTTGAATVDRTPADFRFGGEAPPPGSYVTLSVEDNGCGMTTQILDRIFDPFFTTKFTGRGLGLAAILGIVRVTKGYLGVRSRPGKGSLFTVWLPQASVGATGEKETGRATATATATDDDASWQGGGAALLIDDEETVRHVAGRILKKAGFAVDTAIDGIDGLEKYRMEPERYRLLIIDMTMPRMDGLTLLRTLRDEGCSLPALISSGYDNESAGAAFAGLEPLSLMRKPYTKGEFIKGIGDLLRDHERASS